MLPTLILLIVMIIGITHIIKRKKRTAIAKSTEEHENTLIAKFSENQTVNEIADDISNAVYVLITKEPYKDHVFHIKTSQQGVMFGTGLREVFYKHISESSRQANYQVILKYRFSIYNLPDIEQEEDWEIFSIAISQLIKKYLDEKDMHVTIGQVTRVIYHDGSETNAFGKISTIVYNHPKIEGDW